MVQGSLTTIGSSTDTTIKSGEFMCIIVRSCPLLESVSLPATPHTMDDTVFTELGNRRYLRSLCIQDDGCLVTPRGFSELFKSTTSLEHFAIITTKNALTPGMITDDHLTAISTYQKLKRLNITNAKQLTRKGLNMLVTGMRNSNLEHLRLHNIRCITSTWIEDLASIRKLAVLDLNIPPGSPHLDRTSAVHSLFDKRVDRAHTLCVKIAMAAGGIWPVSDSVMFFSDSYKSSMANQMLALMNSFQHRYNMAP
ncbi:hypothetical protein BDB00DRAFT_818466 [Zychaea mexicana]|uniref:uncharacterized protein n=1 Tax=Zychaea mexicana TaxID=64656 RepID=UPI0022FE20A3|nr:uncharacterized protein BDB00DRAFT_818466 [Zychaea mexicana]KAI9494542.1 hypothetical protein BDB00DRAFT_818466 [Zychaea mexicana]